MSFYDVGEVLSKTDLPEIARRLGMRVERRGVNLTTQCVFHQDSRPSLVLYPQSSKGASHFHCFSCNAHGYAPDLVKKVLGVEFKPAIEWLAQVVGVQPVRGSANKTQASRSSTRDAAFAFAQLVFDARHDEQRFTHWCDRRHFEPKFLHGMGIRLIGAGSPLVGALRAEPFGRQQELIDGLMAAGLLVRLRPDTRVTQQASLDLGEQFRDYFNDGRVLVPINSIDHALMGYAGRLSLDDAPSNPSTVLPAKYLLTPGFKKAGVLFNAGRASKLLKASGASEEHATLYLVEGYFDALRLQSLGLAAVAVMGTSLSDAQKEILTSLLAFPGGEASTVPRVRIFFDLDAAGFEGANRTARQVIGQAGIATEWVGFVKQGRSSGKDPDSLLRTQGPQAARELLEAHSLPAPAILVAASLGYKDATPLLSNVSWNEISRYPRERALLQTARALRALSNSTIDWISRLKETSEPRLEWVSGLIDVLGKSRSQDGSSAVPHSVESSFLTEQSARLNHARMLAEHGSRRGELPCDDETWRALDRNAQLFNELLADRLKRKEWLQTSPYDAVHLPRKLSGDEKVLSDPRRKVMPHAADLHLHQFLMNELLTERHDFSHEGHRAFSDCIPAVRWFSEEDEVRTTGLCVDGESSETPSSTRQEQVEKTLSFAYQIDMDVLDGRKKPSDQGMFRPFIDCWRSYMSSLERQARAIGPRVHVLRLDARRYYDSIQRYVVRDSLLTAVEHAINIAGADDFAKMLGLADGDERAISEKIVDLLCASVFAHTYRHPDTNVARTTDDVIGIPQGPVISAWLGTIALFPVDDAARRFMSRKGQGNIGNDTRAFAGYGRYVDDIVLMADSESRLDELREAVQMAASSLELTLVNKGERLLPGSSELVIKQLNSGRLLAPSVPAWEPPMVGDGETGWGMADDDTGAMDRQSALHLLRHPNLLDDPSTVHEKLREIVKASDLRPSDLGKCARALWWQAAVLHASNRNEASDTPAERAWEDLWAGYLDRWSYVTDGHEWAPAFKRRGIDVLFSVEGLDMLLDSTDSVEKGRTKEWVELNRRGLEALAETVLRSESIYDCAPPSYNKFHIRRRIGKIKWKALQRRKNSLLLFPDSQQTQALTLTDWLCQAATLIRRFGTGPKEEHSKSPLVSLLLDSTLPQWLGPKKAIDVCEILKTDAVGSPGTIDSDASSTALTFLVANTTDDSRLQILRHYRSLLGQGIPDLHILPPLPVPDAGMMAYAGANDSSTISVYAFRQRDNDSPPDRLPGATIENGVATPVGSIELDWLSPEHLAPNLLRFAGARAIALSFRELKPLNRLRYAADLFEVLHSIQMQAENERNEYVTVYSHVCIGASGSDSADLNGRGVFLLSEPIDSEALGVTAWVRDGRGGLRSLSVPGGEHVRLWRVGCAVSDALGMLFDLPADVGVNDVADCDIHSHHQVEDYVLRQQLSKLRGTWLASAQVRDDGSGGIPGTVKRALRILRLFDSEMPIADQVVLVLRTEAETRSMALRIRHKGPGDIRDKLHLVPSFILGRLPLGVLEGLDIPRVGPDSLRTDSAFLIGFATAIDEAQRRGPGEEIDSFRALQIGAVLAATATVLRGVLASIWGLVRQSGAISLPERLPIPAAWRVPDSEQHDSQADYESVCRSLRHDDWPALRDASPWQLMLGVVGVLDVVSPQLLFVESNPVRKAYESLESWQAAEAEALDARSWAWPFDEMPVYQGEFWSALLNLLPFIAAYVDQGLGLQAKQVDAPAYRRQRDNEVFTDSDSQQWSLAKTQFTGVGSSDSVARLPVGARRVPTWTEVRRVSDGELLSVHTIDDKLGRWWHRQVGESGRSNQEARSADERRSGSNDTIPITREPSRLEEEFPRSSEDGSGSQRNRGPSEEQVSAGLALGDTVQGRASDLSSGPRAAAEAPRQDVSDRLKSVSEEASASLRDDVRASRLASWTQRGERKSKAHMRVALLQWAIDETYSHPIAEVGVAGLGLARRELESVRRALQPGSLAAEADNAAKRGNEHLWPKDDITALESWPELRRRRLLSSALDACRSLKVDLLVLPEVSVRLETVDWLEGELQKHYPGIAILAGTYRHFGSQAVESEDNGAPVHHLMAPLTLLWRPDEKLARSLFPEGDRVPKTLRFWRGKKYRAVAAHELFRPDWGELAPLFRVEKVYEKALQKWLGCELPPVHQKPLVLALAEQLPPLRYCMELVCSELFLLTSPANVEPLTQEVATMLRRFPTASGSTDAKDMVSKDYDAVGRELSVLHSLSEPRRSILLVPAATKRSNDYWHAGQASVLASGTATVFCNAANSAVGCGGSCFIGIDAAVAPHAETAGCIETLTPYHGWRKGILTGRLDGPLSGSDQALVVVDIDPVHVVTGRPRPQLLPEPMSLVAYLPVVELMDSGVNSNSVYSSIEGYISSYASLEERQEVRDVLKKIGTSIRHRRLTEPKKFWDSLATLEASARLDETALEGFVSLFPDAEAVRERLLAWARDRHQQPSSSHRYAKREPAWLDFLDVDLTLSPGQPLPTLGVPPWGPAAVPDDFDNHGRPVDQERS